MPGPQPCHYRPFIFCPVGRGLDPSAAFRRRSPPPGGRPPYIPLYHSSQGGVPSPRRNSDGNAYVAYTKDSNEAGTYSEVSKTNKLDAGFTANANSTLNGKTGNEA